MHGFGALWGFVAAHKDLLTTIASSPKNPMATPDAASSPAVPQSYEAALAELERIVSAMEGNQLPLDKLLASYQRGAELLAFCRERLEAVEQQVKVLEDGRLRPYTDS